MLPASRASSGSAIESGAIAVGKRIPSEATLIKTYGVARNTARHAVQLLRDEGWVRTRPQKGTFVVDRSEQSQMDDQGAESD
ncbi:winged helix-turn-helix domain-containing protein [Kitasatospora sp. GP82]|uniref:winged helix-turn-helix domain-containing protein n=1 Tax=Kitasatospora sp. GP82 TaxID=3035089 RepID=UPI00247482DC|nr:winged helix-turn-helix domain-containing protein [Kitasatospora sp. GP82]